jgi:hypothetical protein
MLGSTDVAGEEIQKAMPVERIRIVRIEGKRPPVILARLSRIPKTGNCANMSKPRRRLSYVGLCSSDQ